MGVLVKLGKLFPILRQKPGVTVTPTLPSPIKGEGPFIQAALSQLSLP